MTEPESSTNPDVSTMDPSSPSGAITVKEGRPPANDQEVALDKLMEHAGPLISKYFEEQARVRESEAEEHAREMAFESKLLEHHTRRHRVTVIAASCVSVVILAFAGFMVAHGRDASALDLIKTLGSLVAVGFGGYGYAIGQRSRQHEEDD